MTRRWHLNVAVVLAVLALGACDSASPVAGDQPPSTTTSSRSGPMVDQATQLDALATEMRSTIDALASAVPNVTDRSRTGDEAVSCGVGDADDGTKQWVYSLRIFYAGMGGEVVASSRIIVEERGYRIREQGSTDEEASFTAVRAGDAITVRAGTDGTGSETAAVVFLGYGACVAPDGTVNGVSPP